MRLIPGGGANARSTAILPTEWFFGIFNCQLLFRAFLTTFSDGCLGSNNDEGRSEVR